MTDVSATLLAPAAAAWLEAQRRESARIQIQALSARAANLIRPDGQILTLVTPRPGPGPFSLVLDRAVPLNTSLTPTDQPHLTPNEMHLGQLTIALHSARAWNPRPPWPGAPPSEIVVSQLSQVLAAAAAPDSLAPLLQATRPNTPLLQAATAPVADLCRAVTAADTAAARAAANRLTGLGPGLTPAGDDFLIGFCFGLWFNRPAPVAQRWVDILAPAPAGVTTTVAAAYRAAAARGEAAAAWHHLVRTLVNGNASAIDGAGQQLLQVGHTSGADGLTGFLFALSL